MKLDNYEITYNSGYYLTQEIKVVSKEGDTFGKEYKCDVKTYPSVNACLVGMNESGIAKSKVVEACYLAKGDYVKEEDRRSIAIAKSKVEKNKAKGV